jgi:two-component system, OmpR family, phosphate regulon sensor histidine kinase PhoR
MLNSEQQHVGVCIFTALCINQTSILPFMKQNVIIFVIVVITISLLGLIGIQLYWISNALSVKEANFNRGVSEAISSAIYKYNKLEMADALLRKQEQQDRQINSFFHVVDSLNREYYRELANKALQNNRSVDNFFSERQSDPFHPINEATFDDFFTPKDSLTDSNAANSNVGYAIRGGIQNSSYDEFVDFFQRTKIVNDLFDDLFSNNISYTASSEARSKLLDSLIKTELDIQGIRTLYEFGIYDPLNNALLVQKTGKYSQQLLESAYIFSLFPNLVFRNPELLLVYFPNQKTYLLSRMNMMSAISYHFYFGNNFFFYLYNNYHFSPKEIIFDKK